MNDFNSSRAIRPISDVIKRSSTTLDERREWTADADTTRAIIRQAHAAAADGIADAQTVLRQAERRVFGRKSNSEK